MFPLICEGHPLFSIESGYEVRWRSDRLKPGSRTEILFECISILSEKSNQGGLGVQTNDCEKVHRLHGCPAYPKHLVLPLLLSFDERKAKDDKKVVAAVERELSDLMSI